MKKEELKKANKGITLIALVITIIVLLILAAVSIATLTGDNGILTKAQNAKDLTNQKTAEEEVQIEVLGSLDNSGNINIEDLNSNLISHLTGVNYKGQPLSAENKIETLPAVVEYNGYKILISGDTSTSLEDALKPGEEAKETKKYNYTDGVDVATIPEGFAVSEKENEQKIANGLVIKNKTDGNEFVWIPCTITQYQNAKNAVQRNEWVTNPEYYKNGGEDGSAWSDNYTDQDISNINAVYVQNGVDNTTISQITENWENKQTEVAEESIKKYGGFYIARYEAGIPKTEKTKEFYRDTNSENLEYKKDGGIRGATTKVGLESVQSLAPVSKKGVQAWNLITQPNSKIVAENMYKGNPSVGSYLVDLQAWNHICENIYGANANKTGKSITNSSTWGNCNDNSSVYEKDIEGLWAQHAWNNEWKIAGNYKKGPVTAKALEPNTELGGTNGIELPTGASEDFNNYNIYDMAGNMWEWTTGHNINSETMYVVPRGRWLRSQWGRVPSCACLRSRGTHSLLRPRWVPRRALYEIIKCV